MHSDSLCIHSIPSTDYTSGIDSAVIADIAIAVVPLCCIGICVTVMVIVACTRACAAGAASSRSRRRNVAATATTVPAAATSTFVTSTDAKTDLGASSGAPPPPYPGIGTAYPAQPQAAPAPYPYTYPQQAAGNVYSPQPGYPAEQQQQQQPYLAGENGQLELQQNPTQPQGYPHAAPYDQASYSAAEQPVQQPPYPADPAYPPQPSPAADDAVHLLN